MLLSEQARFRTYFTHTHPNSASLPSQRYNNPTGLIPKGRAPAVAPRSARQFSNPCIRLNRRPCPHSSQLLVHAPILPGVKSTRLPNLSNPSSVPPIYPTRSANPHIPPFALATSPILSLRNMLTITSPPLGISRTICSSTAPSRHQ